MDRMDENEQRRLTSNQYERLADWAEHVALAALVSLVVQKIIEGKAITNWSVLTGMLITAFMYFVAYWWLKRSQ